MRKLCFTLIICLLVVGTFQPISAKAPQKSKQTCQLITSNEAINQAKRKTGGKVVSVKLKRHGKQSVYRVRVLVDKKRIKNLSIKACR